MNKEIKEILEFDFESQGERIEINEYERNMLKDYITNSQEENEYSNHCNEELRKKITNLEYKIERLEEDNKQLKELCDKYEEEHNTTFQIWKYNKDTYKEENERLNNIINELEKWLIDNIEYGDDDYYDMKAMGVESALNKLKELKEDNK